MNVPFRRLTFCWLRRAAASLLVEQESGVKPVKPPHSKFGCVLCFPGNKNGKLLGQPERLTNRDGLSPLRTAAPTLINPAFLIRDKNESS